MAFFIGHSNLCAIIENQQEVFLEHSFVDTPPLWQAKQQSALIHGHIGVIDMLKFGLLDPTATWLFPSPLLVSPSHSKIRKPTVTWKHQRLYRERQR